MSIISPCFPTTVLQVRSYSIVLSVLKCLEGENERCWFTVFPGLFPMLQMLCSWQQSLAPTDYVLNVDNNLPPQKADCPRKHSFQNLQKRSPPKTGVRHLRRVLDASLTTQDARAYTAFKKNQPHQGDTTPTKNRDVLEENRNRLSYRQQRITKHANVGKPEVRRGEGRRLYVTSDCSSQRIGRLPSMYTHTAEPSISFSSLEQKRARSNTGQDACGGWRGEGGKKVWLVGVRK